jgi:hypothetical protein
MNCLIENEYMKGTFQARFEVWSLLLPVQRVLRALERV